MSYGPLLSHRDVTSKESTGSKMALRGRRPSAFSLVRGQSRHNLNPISRRGESASGGIGWFLNRSFKSSQT